MTAVALSAPTIWAHRGASHRHPENTLAAFRAAIDLGADGIEFDIGLTADGVAVVLHDAYVDRTTNGSGLVADFTSSDLARLDAGDGERVPRLEEVLELAAGRVSVNIEIKAAASVPAVMAALRARPVDAIVSSAHWGALRDVAVVDGTIPRYPLCFAPAADLEGMHEMARRHYGPERVAAELGAFADTDRGLDAALEEARDTRAAGLSIWHDGLTRADVDRIRSAGLRVWVWTVDDPQRAIELAEWQVDGLCSNVPDLIRSVIISRETPTPSEETR